MGWRIALGAYLSGLMLMTSPADGFTAERYHERVFYEEPSDGELLKAAWEEIEETGVAKRIENFYDNKVRQYGKLRLLDKDAELKVEISASESLDAKIAGNGEGETQDTEEHMLSFDLLDSKPSLDIKTPYVDGCIEAVPLKKGVACEFKSDVLNSYLHMDVKMETEYIDEEFRTSVGIHIPFN